jgi:hypothetical protein
MLWGGYAGERGTEGAYGFGFVDRKTSRHSASGRKAIAGVGRHDVSARLVRETGITIRALRVCNWLYMRRQLVATGELYDEWIPEHWTPSGRRRYLQR